jgi:hypothetical protein
LHQVQPVACIRRIVDEDVGWLDAIDDGEEGYCQLFGGADEVEQDVVERDPGGVAPQPEQSKLRQERSEA